ncbi:MAG: DUF1634 domain-containing protein [Sporolactobacillus sp.]
MAEDQSKFISEDELKKAQKMNKIEWIIGQVLRIGVILSAVVILIGIFMILVTGHSGYAGMTYPITPMAILRGLAAFKPYAVLMTGLFLLILTPVLRVVVSIYAFAVEKDHLYVWITTVVLIILLIGMSIGYNGH